MHYLIAVFMFLINSSYAEAAARKVFFSQTATNFTTTSRGAISALNSTCTITISNVGPTSQTFSISALTVTSVGTTAGIVSGTASPTCTGAVSASNATCYTSVVLAAASSQTITWTYPNFGAGEIGTQTITCAGTIDVFDTAASSPGFVFGNGTLLSFIESGAAKALVGGGSIAGGAIFNQIPITIGEGRPF